MERTNKPNWSTFRSAVRGRLPNLCDRGEFDKIEHLHETYLTKFRQPLQEIYVNYLEQPLRDKQVKFLKELLRAKYDEVLKEPLHKKYWMKKF